MSAALFVCLALNVGAPDLLERCAQAEAVRMMAALEIKRSVRVEVHDDGWERWPKLKAYTVRREGHEGCAVHLRPSVATDPAVIAHEVCHCALDYEAMSTTGFKGVIDGAERDAREKRAAACADWLQ